VEGKGEQDHSEYLKGLKITVEKGLEGIRRGEAERRGKTGFDERKTSERKKTNFGTRSVYLWDKVNDSLRGGGSLLFKREIG